MEKMNLFINGNYRDQGAEVGSYRWRKGRKENMEEAGERNERQKRKEKMRYAE